MSTLDDPRRLAVIESLRLLDKRVDAVFDSATRLASQVIGTPVALVSIVTDDRQVFASQVGLASPWAEQAETPLSHSFCQYVVTSDAPLRVVDAREDQLLKDNGAIPDLGVVAYFGVPLRAPGGETIGSFCVIDDQPREWTDADLAALEDLAGLVEHVLLSRQASGLLLEALEERDNLVSMLVHDIRQPMTAAMMAASILDRGLDRIAPGTAREVVDSMNRQLVRVDGLLSELTEPRRNPVRVVDLVTVAQDLRRMAEASRLGDVVVQVPARTTVLGVPTDVERIVSNLVRNAFVHGGDGVTVTIAATRNDVGVRIVVSDDGRGIAAEDVERIFAFGEQGEANGGGSGLGLHIVRTLARRTGGDVTVASVPGGGATFVVDLRDIDHDPAAYVDDEALASLDPAVRAVEDGLA